MGAWRAAAVAGLLLILLTAPVAAKNGEAGSWSRAPDMLHEHVGHTATLLEDGRVLIAGGANIQGEATTDCELFDPKTNRWTPAASLNFARVRHAATRLPNGDVLVLGGGLRLDSLPWEALSSAEVYHVASNQWLKVRSMQLARKQPIALLLHDGRVLVVGGARSIVTVPPPSPILTPVSEAQRAEIYPAADEVGNDGRAFAGDGLPVVDDMAATLLPDGRMLVTGGLDPEAGASADVEWFDASTNRWQAAPVKLATPRYGHTATLLKDGTILIAGGYTTKLERFEDVTELMPEPLTSSEVIDLRTGKTTVQASTLPRLDHTSTLLSTGAVLIVGGANNVESQLFDPSVGAWLSAGARMDRYLHTATLLKDRHVLIAGGTGVDGPRSAWEFSPALSAPAPMASSSTLQNVAAVVLLLVFVALAAVATSRGLHGLGRKRLADETEWLEP